MTKQTDLFSIFVVLTLVITPAYQCQYYIPIIDVEKSEDKSIKY